MNSFFKGNSKQKLRIMFEQKYPKYPMTRTYYDDLLSNFMGG